MTETRIFEIGIGFSGSHRVGNFSPHIIHVTLNFHVSYPIYGTRLKALTYFFSEWTNANHRN